MSQTVEQIIASIQNLPPHEQARVLRWLEEHKPEASEKTSEEELEAEVLKRLLARGLISEIPAGWDDDEDFEPIEIDGEPLSEMIIRERR